MQLTETYDRAGSHQGSPRDSHSPETSMSVAKVSEIIASSDTSFDDAIKLGIARAHETLRNVKGAWVESMKVDCNDGRIVRYRVALKVTFVIAD